MKILVVGGTAQNKLIYVQERYKIETHNIADCKDGVQWDKPVIYRLHILVENLLQMNKEPRLIIDRLSQRKSWIVICNEVGSGVVPINANERIWREQVGRICIELAKQADVVERVTCGLSHRIKG